MWREIMSKKIAFIVLRKRGAAMVTQLLKSGTALTVYNRTKEKAAPLIALGAELA